MGYFQANRYWFEYRKVQLILQDIDVAKAITHDMQPPPPNATRTSTEHRRDLDAYTAWKSKNITI